MTAIDLRLGCWQDVLADVGQVDAVITDPPYSKRTILGHRSGGPRAADGWQDPVGNSFEYTFTVKQDIANLVWWSCEISSWLVMFGDHYMMMWAEDALPGDWYGYAPLSWVKTDAAPRMNGDGPSPSVEHIFVARKRSKLPLRFRPGHYIHPRAKDGVVTGAKPLGLMRAVVRDYSEPGALIADPFAGGATTLIAAAIEGRRAIGAEMDPDTYAKAKRRIEAGYTPNMFHGVASA